MVVGSAKTFYFSLEGRAQGTQGHSTGAANNWNLGTSALSSHASQRDVAPPAHANPIGGV